VVGVVSDVRYREWQSVRPDFSVSYTLRARHRIGIRIALGSAPGWVLELIAVSGMRTVMHEAAAGLAAATAMVWVFSSLVFGVGCRIRRLGRARCVCAIHAVERTGGVK
jgi:hypothetical protein